MIDMIANDLEILQQSAVGLLFFALYLLVALLMLGLFTLLYVSITPHHEFGLIRAGNVSAAISFGGALIGFVIPLAKSVAQSTTIFELLMWGAVALVVQLLVYGIVCRILPGLSQRIISDDRATGIFIATAAITVGLLNAAAMTGG